MSSTNATADDRNVAVAILELESGLDELELVVLQLIRDQASRKDIWAKILQNPSFVELTRRLATSRWKRLTGAWQSKLPLEDLIAGVQRELFLRNANEKSFPWEPRERFAKYLSKAIFRMCLELIRPLWRERPVQSIHSTSDPEASDRVEDEVNAHEAYVIFLKTLNSLPAPLKAIAQAYYLDDKKQIEIAELLDRSAAWVCLQIKIIESRLRVALIAYEWRGS